MKTFRKMFPECQMISAASVVEPTPPLLAGAGAVKKEAAPHPATALICI